MKIDRKLLRDKAYVIKLYATSIVRTAEKIEALSRSKAKPGKIAEGVNEAAGYIQEFWQALESAGRKAKIVPGFQDKEHDDSVRQLAVIHREDEKRRMEKKAAAEAGASKAKAPGN